MFAGFHSVALHRDPLAVAIAKVAAAGYRGIELNAETLPWAWRSCPRAWANCATAAATSAAVAPSSCFW